MKKRRRSALPGFGLSIGVTLTYLGLLVVIPLSTVIIKTTSMSASQFWATISSDRAIASYGLSIGASLVPSSHCAREGANAHGRSTQTNTRNFANPTRIWSTMAAYAL